MLEVSDEQFDKIISEVMEELPKKHTKALDNVAIVMADQPTTEQLHKMQIRPGHTLFGLYEGVPLTQRGAGYNMVLPDKITIFKYPILAASSDLTDFRAQVKHTLWHEIAHHFGLNHDRINRLESG